MTDNILIPETENTDKLKGCAFLSAVVLLSLGLSVWAGFSGLQGWAVGVNFTDPLGDSLPTGAARLCAVEFLCVAVFTFCRGEALRTVFSAAAFSLRGAAMGAWIAVYAENPAYGELAGLLVSYGAVTLLTAFYCIIMHRQGSELPLAYKLAAYTVVSGAAAVIRIMPYLLL